MQTDTKQGLFGEQFRTHFGGKVFSHNYVRKSEQPFSGENAVTVGLWCNSPIWHNKVVELCYSKNSSFDKSV